MPGGAIIDAAKSERLVAGLAIATIGCSALAYAAWPIFPVIAVAATLHAAASCVLARRSPRSASVWSGRHAIGERLGRNARFASLGNGVAAALMGTCGYLLSSRSVFLVAFVLAIPTLLALMRIREREVDAARAHGSVLPTAGTPNRPVFWCCCVNVRSWYLPEVSCCFNWPTPRCCR